MEIKGKGNLDGDVECKKCRQLSCLFGARFSALVLLTFGLMIVVAGSCHVHWRTFSSIPGFSVAPCSPPVTTENVSRHCQMAPGRGELNRPLLRSIVLEINKLYSLLLCVCLSVCLSSLFSLSLPPPPYWR